MSMDLCSRMAKTRPRKQRNQSLSNNAEQIFLSNLSKKGEQIYLSRRKQAILYPISLLTYLILPASALKVRNLQLSRQQPISPYLSTMSNPSQLSETLSYRSL